MLYEIGITINTLLVGENKLDKYGDHKTFIGQVVIRLRNHVIAISPNYIIYDEKVIDIWLVRLVSWYVY